jgi:hypothetical protein
MFQQKTGHINLGSWVILDIVFYIVSKLNAVDPKAVSAPLYLQQKKYASTCWASQKKTRCPLIQKKPAFS